MCTKKTCSTRTNPKATKQKMFCLLLHIYQKVMPPLTFFSNHRISCRPKSSAQIHAKSVRAWKDQCKIYGAKKFIEIIKKTQQTYSPGNSKFTQKALPTALAAHLAPRSIWVDFEILEWKNIRNTWNCCLNFSDFFKRKHILKNNNSKWQLLKLLLIFILIWHYFIVFKTILKCSFFNVLQPSKT